MPPCDVTPDCLECPLPACKYDDTAPYNLWKIAHRDVVEEMIPKKLLGYYEGQVIEEIAERSGVSSTTIRLWGKKNRIVLMTRARFYVQVDLLGIARRKVHNWINDGHIRMFTADDWERENYSIQIIGGKIYKRDDYA